MGSEPKGMILFFRGRQGRTASPRTAGGLPRVVRIETRTERKGDEEVNAEWDRLMKLAIQAWSWRDLESLGVLRDTLATLERRVEPEWS